MGKRPLVVVSEDYNTAGQRCRAPLRWHPSEINAAPLRSMYNRDTVTKFFVAAGITSLSLRG
jgi:hypothetical protein